MRRRTALSALGSALVSATLLIPLALYIRRVIDRDVARRRHPHRPTSQTEGTGTSWDIEWKGAA